ncbi:MAG: hypothetical protein KC417_11250, partial [Myxococcales bacterium]|nr:hypothetical protein [Myxococcales bacterium]
LRTNTERSRVSVSNAVAAMWRDIGLDVDVQPIETASLLSDLGRGRFEAVLMTVPEVIEPHVLSWFFASDRIPGPGTEGANRWRLRNPALDAARDRGCATSDLGARRAAYDDAQRILGQELPVLPLWHDDVVLVRRSAFPAVHVPRDARFGGVVR